MTNFWVAYRSLFRRDMIIFKRNFFSKVLDTFILLSTNLVVFAYFMPHMGMSQSYGPFLLIGAIATYGFFDIVGKVAEMIGDIEGDRRIYYNLTLPLSSKMVLHYLALYWALNTFLLTVVIIPMGKLILWSRFDLSIINYPKLILIFLTGNIFFGYFSIWLVSMIKEGLDTISMIWIRVVVPMFMFGAYFYTWEASFQVSPIIGYISLINPLVHLIEGMRSATLGAPEQYLSYWSCVGSLWLFTLFCATHGIYRMKKKLDCV